MVFWEQLQRYSRVALWLFRDALVRFRRDTLRVIVFGCFSLIGQLAVILILTYMGHALETGAGISLHGWYLDPRSGTTLAILLVFLCIALLVAVVSDFLARNKAIALMGEYGTFCLTRLIACASRSPDGAVAGPRAPAPKSVEGFFFLQRDATYAGVVLRQCLLSIVPALQAIGYGAALCYLDPGAFLMIISVVAVAFVFFYRQSVEGARWSMAIERLVRRARSQQLGILRLARQSRLPPPLEEAEIGKCVAQGASRDLSEALLGRYRVVLQTDLTTKLVSVLAIMLVVAMLGYRALEESSGWALLLVYIIVLRACFSSVRAVAVAITYINRFYPQVSRYMAFVNVSQTEPSACDFGPLCEIRIRAVSLYGDADELVLSKGAPLGLITPARLSDVTIVGLWAGLDMVPRRAGLSLLASARWVSGAFSGTSDTDGLAADRAELAKQLAEAGLPDAEIEELPPDLGDPTLQTHEWRTKHRRMSAALALLDAAGSQARAAVIPHHVFRAVTLDAIQKWFQEKFVFILYDRCPSRPRDFKIEHFVLTDGHTALGWADSAWLRGHQDEIADKLADLRVQRQARRAAVADGEGEIEFGIE